MLSLLAGGAVAGALNTLASSGSAITLPLLILLGIPPGVANGTNRLSVLLGSLSAVISFQKSGSIPWKKAFRLSIPLALGSVLGAGNFAFSTDANVSASPDIGYSFSGWIGKGLLAPSASSTSVRMTEDRNIPANFSLNS